MVIWQCLGVLASLVPLTGCSGPDANARTEQRLPLISEVESRLRRGAHYYVAPTGSDDSPGTARQPFRTIQKAADLASAGDTVFVRPGTYTGGARIVSMSRPGAPGRPITFLSERKWEAVLDGRNGGSREAWYFGPGVAYITINGFEVRDLEEHAFDFYGGGVHDILIIRNHVHHVGRNCTDTRNGRTGASIGAGAYRITFDGNVWHHIGRFGPGEQGCSPRTKYYQNHDHGIYVADASQVVIQNNIFYAFERGWPVQRYSSAESRSRGLAIVNNTFAGRNPYREGHIILATSTDDLRIENNIFHGPNTAALYFENLRFSGAQVRYNMISGAVLRLGKPRGVEFSRNWEKTEPRFREPTDFRLRYDSPAVDAGMAQPDVRHDADGVSRPRGAGYDLGAYER
jgi:Right handed beta helix region/Protein of unknown function (DUF1565)